MNSMEDCFELINGVKVPCLGFGTYLSKKDEAMESVLTAVRNGYRHIDTALAYGNEDAVGEAIRQSGVSRNEIFVTTKHWVLDRGYKKTVEAIDRSLTNLGMDYLDLYLMHWPCVEKVSSQWAELNAETWRGFEAAYQEGKIRALGVSNFQKKHLDALEQYAKVKPMVNQIEFHPGYLQQNLVDYSKEKGMLVQAFSPLALGVVFKNDTMHKLAEKYERSIAQITLRFVLQKGVNPLTKSVHEQRIIENAQIFDFEIEKGDMHLIENLPKMGFTGWRPEDAPADALVNA